MRDEPKATEYNTELNAREFLDRLNLKSPTSLYALLAYMDRGRDYVKIKGKYVIFWSMALLRKLDAAEQNMEYRTLLVEYPENRTTAGRLFPDDPEHK